MILSADVNWWVKRLCVSRTGFTRKIASQYETIDLSGGCGSVAIHLRRRVPLAFRPTKTTQPQRTRFRLYACSIANLVQSATSGTHALTTRRSDQHISAPDWISTVAGHCLSFRLPLAGTVFAPQVRRIGHASWGTPAKQSSLATRFLPSA